MSVLHTDPNTYLFFSEVKYCSYSDRFGQKITKVPLVYSCETVLFTHETLDICVICILSHLRPNF